MNNELYHYGVLGMKWGVRRNPSKAYARAVKKKDKLEDKWAKKDVKAAKKDLKASKKMANATSGRKLDKALQAQAKANKVKLKAARLHKKGLKWEQKMDSVFKTYDVKRIPNGNIDAGKSYVYRMMYGDDRYDVK
jgi:uncharacterized protein YabN with tetrapyrrole methylase and pyrophosphatase domain